MREHYKSIISEVEKMIELEVEAMPPLSSEEERLILKGEISDAIALYGERTLIEDEESIKRKIRKFK